VAEEENKAPSYVVPPSRNPSYLNMNTAVGFVAGMITGIPFAGFIGAAIGGYIGKKKMDKEQAEGKEVTAPTMWNKGTFIGGGAGLLSAQAFGGLVAMTLGTGGLGFFGILGAAALMGAGAWIGGKITYNMRQKEYAEAREYAHFNGDYSPERAQTEGISPSQEPELAQSQQQSAGEEMKPASEKLPKIDAPAEGVRKAVDALPAGQLSQLRGFASEGRAMSTDTPSETSMASRVANSRTTSASAER
jgi:hypothetical protein